MEVTMPGGRKQTIEDKDILAAIEKESTPAVFTGQLADKFDFSNPGMLSRLDNLEQEGLVESHTRGRMKIWWLTDEGRAFLENK